MSTNKASAGDTGTFNTPHGAGSMFGQVAIGGQEMPWFVEERVDQWCVVKGTREEPGETVACHDSQDKANAQMAALYASEEKSADESPADLANKAFEQLGDKDQGVVVYKQDDGTFRWASISSVAVKDKEFEIVTEKAQDDAIQHAIDTGEFGEIDLVHIEGTDVGKCDFMARAGKRLVEGGTFDDTDLARGAIKALNEDPDHWGISIQFVYDPSKFDGEKYNGNIRIKKRTILPQEMAASYGTRLVAIGGEQPMEKQVVSDKAREALEKLNVPEDEIEKLAEKQVEVEPGTVNKEAEAEPAEVETQETSEVEVEAVEAETPEPETAGAEKSRLAQIIEAVKAAFSKPEAEKADEPGAETGGEETTEVEPVEAQETKEADLTEVFKGLLDVYTDATVTAVADALKKQQEAHDAQLGSLGEALKLVSDKVQELAAPIEDRIEKRLAELPPIVKAAPSMTASLEKPKNAMLPIQGKTATVNYANELVKSVHEVTAKLGSTPTVEV